MQLHYKLLPVISFKFRSLSIADSDIREDVLWVYEILFPVLLFVIRPSHILSCTQSRAFRISFKSAVQFCGTVLLPTRFSITIVLVKRSWILWLYNSWFNQIFYKPINSLNCPIPWYNSANIKLFYISENYHVFLSFFA